MYIFTWEATLCFQTGDSDAEYDEETELFEQECNGFMKEFVTKIFLKEYVLINIIFNHSNIKCLN